MEHSAIRRVFTSLAEFYHGILALLPTDARETNLIARHFPLYHEFVVVIEASGQDSPREAFRVIFSPALARVTTFTILKPRSILTLRAPGSVWARVLTGRLNFLGAHVQGLLRVSHVREFSFHLYLLTLLFQGAAKLKTRSLVIARLCERVSPVARPLVAGVLKMSRLLRLARLLHHFLHEEPAYQLITGGGRGA